MNYNNFAQETSRMLELMKYGINENASKSSAPRVEYSVKAADGLTYGIVNEGTKFYIKVAPKKDTQLLNEDFDYIGGEVNKKQNEYKSYASASKNLELKLMQINEANKATKILIESTKRAPEADWQVNETVEMRNAINRMNQISRNVAHILTEGSIPSEHTLPEAPAKNPSQSKVNSPFTNTAVAKGDKDFTKTETNYETPSGSPYNSKAKAKMTSDKSPSLNGNNGNAYSDSCQYAPKNSIAHSHATGGKVTRADEGKRVIKLTEDQVLAWSRDNDNYLDTSHGTEIGSTSPFDEELDCKTSNQCKQLREGALGEYDDDDIAGFDGYDEDGYPYEDDGYDEDGYPFDDDEVPFSEVEDDDEFDLEIDDDDADLAREAALSDIELDDDNDDYDEDDLEYEDYDDDSNNGGEDSSLNEQSLNVFGKHPAYRKTPMTLPANREVARNGARDWNDESVEGEEPFGKKIGSSAPFEKAVQRITNSVMESLGF